MKIQIWESTPANINNMKTICQEEWYKIPTYYGKKLIEINWKKLGDEFINKTYRLGWRPTYRQKYVNERANIYTH